MTNYKNIAKLIKNSKRLYKKGLIFIFEGVEGVGKTSTSWLLHNELLKNKIKSLLLIEHYERTNHSGPLIAALTENPCITLNNDLVLFLLYCARLADKIFLARKFALSADIVIVDRLDLSLTSRAIAGWGISKDSVNIILDIICKDFYKEKGAYFIQALHTYNEDIRKKRLLNKGKFRRRDFLAESQNKKTIIHFLDLIQKLDINVIDTSKKTHLAIIKKINANCLIK